MELKLTLIFLGAVFTNNFVLSYFLGICPFLGVSGKWESAWGMGLATTFVMTVASAVTWSVYHYILHPFDLLYLEYVTFIMVISSTVQIVELIVHKFNEGLYRSLGIYLPLITTNCAILGMALFMVLRDYSFIEAVIFGFGAGAGFTLAIVIMAGIREELEFADVPAPFKGGPITLIIAGILALAFMGFGGMIAQ